MPDRDLERRMLRMDKDYRKARKLVILLFFSCIGIALLCFGICAYLVVTTRGAEVIDQRLVEITKAIVMIGIFFLVLGLGYLLPILISHKKQKAEIESRNGTGIGGISMSGIFDETNMRCALEKYIPDGETLLAGIHAAANETVVTCVFGGCVRVADRLRPDKDGGTVALSKKKYSAYDIYIGITQHFLVMADCEHYSYYYQFDDEPNARETDIQKITADVLFADIGKCFPLTDIQSCDIKKGWLGSVKCFITMKNGSYFKLMFPKLGGLGGGMPHHAEYRDAIIARLGGSGT